MPELSLTASLLGNIKASAVIHVQNVSTTTISDLQLTVAERLIGQVPPHTANQLRLYNVCQENISPTDPRLSQLHDDIEAVFPQAVFLHPFELVAKAFPDIHNDAR